MTVRLSLAVGIALLAGASGVAAFAPFYFWPAAPVSLAVLFALWLSAPSVWRTFAVTVAWSMGLFGAGVSWLYVSLHVYGDMPAWLSAIAIGLFCGFLTCYVLAAALLQHALRKRHAAGPEASLLLIMPACFVAGELLRGALFGGFPWLSMGFSQTPGGVIPAPLAGFAPLAGAFGISWLIAILAGALAMVFDPRLRIEGGRKRLLSLAGAAVALCVICWLAGKIAWTDAAGEPLSVALVQGNIDQQLKWRADQLQPSMDAHLRLVERSEAKLIVLPETVLPIFLDETPVEYLAELKSRAEKNGGDLLFGVPTQRPVAGNVYAYFNSVVSLGRSPSQHYDKSHLVVFGEFVPPWFGWVLQWLNIPMSGFAPGDARAGPLAVAGQRIGINICYEDAFGDEIARQLPTASLLVNVSNMAWYGRSLAADQHGQMSQMRAMETGRWMLRATNTGLTAAIDEHGKIVKSLPQFTRGVLSVDAQPRQGSTPYVRWTDWPVRIGLLALLVFFAIGRRKNA